MKDELIERVARTMCCKNGDCAAERVQFSNQIGVRCSARIFRDSARAALSAIRPGDELPCGIVMPMEATRKMIEAAISSESLDGKREGGFWDALRENRAFIYLAMIEAVKKDAKAEKDTAP